VRVTIWGCRGSLPTPGAATVRYGGNTSCVEVALDSGTVLVLDAGSGIRRLGLDLGERKVRRLCLLLTHLHLDHIEGLRFFQPLFDEQFRLEVWGPPSPVVSLEERIARAFSPPLFPIDLRTLPAQVSFQDVPREPWSIDGAKVSAQLVAHPGPTLGFRIEAESSTLAYLPDHEPALYGPIETRTRDWISGCSIAEEADLLLHDAQYDDAEYRERTGWGHSSVTDALAFARAAGSSRVVLFHHDPARSDEELETLADDARAFAGDGLEPPTVAREGMAIELP
jgi:phosphoribosyl 1,2-cyclic phosphodiesterase